MFIENKIAVAMPANSLRIDRDRKHDLIEQDEVGVIERLAIEYPVNERLEEPTSQKALNAPWLYCFDDINQL